MFDYVTEIEYVKIDDELTHDIEVSGLFSILFVNIFTLYILNF